MALDAGEQRHGSWDTGERVGGLRVSECGGVAAHDSEQCIAAGPTKVSRRNRWFSPSVVVAISLRCMLCQLSFYVNKLLLPFFIYLLIEYLATSLVWRRDNLI